MVGIGTIVEVCDNSGVLFVRCFGPGRSFRGGYARIGNFLTGSVRKTKNSSILKGNKVRVLLCQTKGGINRLGGSKLSLNVNLGILWNTVKGSPVGTRVNCPIPNELRTIVEGGSKLISMSNIIL